eukprot:sb/3465863/
MSRKQCPGTRARSRLHPVGGVQGHFTTSRAPEFVPSESGQNQNWTSLLEPGGKVRFKRLDLRFLEIGVLHVILTKNQTGICMKFLFILLIPAVASFVLDGLTRQAVAGSDPEQILFFSEQDFLTTSLQARTGVPIFVEYGLPICGDISLDTAHWICRKQGHTRGALSVMKNSDAPGRAGPTKAMMAFPWMFGRSFFTNFKCAKNARWLDGCTYMLKDRCPFGEETVVECDAGEGTSFPAFNMAAGYGDEFDSEPRSQGTVLVQMGDTDKYDGSFTRMSFGYFCAADVKNQATADKICKLLWEADTTRAVEWKRAGDVTDPKMRLSRSAMDIGALRAIKMGPCDTVETCGLEEDWNLCGPEDSLSIKCE